MDVLGNGENALYASTVAQLELHADRGEAQTPRLHADETRHAVLETSFGSGAALVAAQPGAALVAAQPGATLVAAQPGATLVAAQHARIVAQSIVDFSEFDGDHAEIVDNNKSILVAYA